MPAHHRPQGARRHPRPRAVARARPEGCIFAPRCDLAIDACRAELPPLVEVEPGQRRAASARPRCGSSARPSRPAPPTSRPRRPRTRCWCCAAWWPPTARCRSCTTSTCTSSAASAWPWSASRAAARRRSPDPSPACTPSATARSCSTARPWPTPRGGRSADVRKRIQYVFQNPYGSLNPRRTVGESVARPLALLGARRQGGAGDRWARCSSASSLVRRLRAPLPRPALRRRAPARGDRPGAGRASPTCSSATRSRRRSTCRCRRRSSSCWRACSATSGSRMLFVTHNLPLVRSIAQHVAVMRDGRIVESGRSTTSSRPRARVHPAAAGRHAADRGGRGGRDAGVSPDAHVAPGFEAVAATFAEVVPDDGPGAAFAATVDGRPVVDLWAARATTTARGGRTTPCACSSRAPRAWSRPRCSCWWSAARWHWSSPSPSSGPSSRPPARRPSRSATCSATRRGCPASLRRSRRRTGSTGRAPSRCSRPRRR